MKTAWIQLDELLRGERTRTLERHPEGLRFQGTGMASILCLLAISYGLCMGSFALARGIETGGSDAIQQGLLQMSASMLKMPLLFLTTLAVTFPSLFVFSALAGSQLKIGEVFRLLISAMAVNLAVLASLGPIVAFFSVSTPNYPFVLLLNVLCCSIGGMLGLAFLLQTLHRLSRPQGEAKRETVPSEQPHESGMPQSSADALIAGPLTRTEDHALSRHARKVFLIWIVVFGLVGAQMGWVLRPFIGSPGKPFSWLRPRDSNVFESVWQAFRGLFG